MSSRRFEVELTTQAEKDLKRLWPWTAQATRAILRLEEDPYRRAERRVAALRRSGRI